MTAARAWRTAAGLLVLAGWALVLRGLFLLPPSEDPQLDLEAGAAFGVNLSVYLPAVVLTGALLVGLLVAVAARAASVTAASAGVAGAFALWVSGHDALCSYLPGLERSLLLGVALEAAAASAAVVAGTLAAADRRRCPGTPGEVKNSS